ncbi:SDR family NAD(P)-dependent oxidoreductase [Nocardia seriolae]|uniref:Carbonyl reductase n=1 Tax=Nocardia seriolae TaxID=37332 RepID=A0ABC8AY05_9NOCA|nr:SDR family NAD(P)-dependent oxidoreductase [Nocardia seriolae]APA99285.1 Carbonyl reductase (NADPH) [Nocardia seriolae]OJF80987.1 carbonyl reductase [Nocardia seriolae]PSK28907.1 carbonyl reductase [Nocardia seriolae]QOW35042.1 SDR family NAD(P)-dependent oxidoreductase [Nocardia seriolae]QUN17495.1 SDR family NAD(P)-dependent oxidoreductase [Nocardia seriolae]
MSRVALVTGATQGLGSALVEGLARRLGPDDTVYLTGRDPGRIDAAVAGMPVGRARVRGELFDVADPESAEHLAAQLLSRHGGIDVVIGNAYRRVGPDDDPREIIGEYAEVNNFGTTRLLRAFAPILRDDARLLVVASSLGTLHQLAPVLHNRFDAVASLDELDAQVAAWRDAVADGSARSGAWPGFVNIPSKIAQVAAVRVLAARRRESDRARGIRVAAVCPGMINTPTSALWWNVAAAPTPAEAAVALLDLALDPIDPAHYGQLVRAGKVLPWSPSAGAA